MAGEIHMTPALSDALTILGAAGIVIPTFARFKINPVIGFIVVGIIAGPLTGDALTEKVNEVLADVDLGAKRKWADEVASAASTALAGLSQKGIDISAAGAIRLALLRMCEQLPSASHRASGLAFSAGEERA